MQIAESDLGREAVIGFAVIAAIIQSLSVAILDRCHDTSAAMTLDLIAKAGGGSLSVGCHS